MFKKHPASVVSAVLLVSACGHLSLAAAAQLMTRGSIAGVSVTPVIETRLNSPITGAVSLSIPTLTPRALTAPTLLAAPNVAAPAPAAGAKTALTDLKSGAARFARVDRDGMSAIAAQEVSASVFDAANKKDGSTPPVPPTVASDKHIGNARVAVLDLGRYALVAGGFGKDGATGESVPLKNSIENAKKLYDALDVPINAKGKKAIGAKIDDDIFGIECDESGCQVTVIIRDTKVPTIGVNKNIRFNGTVARAIFEALPKSSEKVKVGAATRSIGNLSCSRSSGRGAPVFCTVTNMNYSSNTLDQMEGQGMPREAIEALIKATGLE